MLYYLLVSAASRFTASVYKMPFAGKYPIEMVSKTCMRERYKGPKAAKALGGLAFMGLMVGAHVSQTLLGGAAFDHDSALFVLGDESILRRAEAAYDVLYCGANSAVTAAQVYISYRIGRSLVKTLRRPALVKPFEVGIETEVKEQNACAPYTVGIETDVEKFEPHDSYPSYEVGIETATESQTSRRTLREWRHDNAKPIRFATDCAVTLGAQVCFMVSALH